jgi:CHAT domain-containing protein
MPSLMSDVRVLLAAESRPGRHWHPLLHTEDEIKNIQSVIPADVVVSETLSLITARMLQFIPKLSILHLACHGFHDPQDSLHSGFVMADGLLTVDMLMSLNLTKGFLAFLSACETARGDGRQPDQAINLATAMLFVGFKSVVGTMW